jgi:hypothetical protein
VTHDDVLGNEHRAPHDLAHPAAALTLQTGHSAERALERRSGVKRELVRGGPSRLGSRNWRPSISEGTPQLAGPESFQPQPQGEDVAAPGTPGTNQAVPRLSWRIAGQEEPPGLPASWPEFFPFPLHAQHAAANKMATRPKASRSDGCICEGPAKPTTRLPDAPLGPVILISILGREPTRFPTPALQCRA